uniref:Uncharacterized protein n=1 Tax=Panagrolaimus sp. PS1159 TaxID=55785 RepID=A0AC35FSP8_9BILA
MAPTLGTVAGPILNQCDGILGQSHHQQVSPVVASNNFQPKMMSEISPMLQSQNVNQSGLEAFHHQQQHLAQLHAFQQQHQQRMGLPQSVQQPPPQNRVIPNGNISPPRVPLPLAMAPPQQMRLKRPGQSEAFQPSEPLNKRSTPGFLPNITPQLQQQLSAMSNPQQQMALLQQVQQQQLQQQHQQSLPTSAAMQLSALHGHLPPHRLPFSGGPGFQQQPSYNPPNSVISTNETLQTHLRALQAPGMPGPPRPTFADPSGDFANLMAIMASNQNQNRLLEELKRTTGFDQNQFLNQLIRQEQLLQAQQKNQQQQHQQQNLMHMAIVQQQQHQQQQQQHQQQQNNQRRQSLPAPVPNSIGTVSQAAAIAASQANGTSFSNVCNAMPSPSKEASSTSSSANSANNTSPNQNATYNREISPPPLGPAECRYQFFLNSIDLFNRGLVDDKNGLVDRYNIPENVAEVATLTYRAEIPMPVPTLSLNHPALRNYDRSVSTSSAAPIVDVEENAETSEQ